VLLPIQIKRPSSILIARVNKVIYFFITNNADANEISKLDTISILIMI
jgi:hypothetical protein